MMKMSFAASNPTESEPNQPFWLVQDTLDAWLVILYRCTKKMDWQKDHKNPQQLELIHKTFYKKRFL